MKKILIIFLLILVLGLNVGCSTTSAYSKEHLPKVVMITAKEGVGNDTINRLAYEGVLRAANDYELVVVLKEFNTKNDYIDAVSTAVSEGADLVIAVDFVNTEELVEIAQKETETFFAVLDSSEVAADNTMFISFKDEESAFLLGVIAALTTETREIGFIGGERLDEVRAIEYGFKAGVKAIDPRIEVTSRYADCFNDPNLGEAIATVLINEGVDIIFNAAGQCDLGSIRAADSADVLCYAYKRVDNGVYLSIQSMMEDDFHSGLFEFGLDFDAVGYEDREGNLPKEVKDIVDNFAAEILAGNIKVPIDQTELDALLIEADF